MFGTAFNWRGALRQRINAVLAVFAGSAACCLCGVLLTFVMAPGQALQAFRVSRLPLMGAAEVAAADPGDLVVITGFLAGNAPAREDSQLVAYAEDEWEVTPPDADTPDNDPSGRWVRRGTVVPALSVEVGGEVVQIHAASNARLSGPLHEEETAGRGPLQAQDGDIWIKDGARRYRGLAEGDLVTVLGQKAAAGGILPQQLFAGDRVAFEKSQEQAASALLFSGLTSMALAPIVLVVGLLAVLFGRRR